ncbi:TonB-dependent receptor domain-containing protein [Enterovibrio nigricans]|uniref:Vitamin B12 transporter BtuB n=1 Tax=Enterovibrio nigricans DSM 22720 TaxID=1121868 RepID=A0A1T4UA26_9GAMM|nr:TonB-dependent receptor [Enterovibrio nigricans]SKA49595.1 vitamin B12 transporter [Enterovibrio nigricans DSM 22720]
MSNKLLAAGMLPLAAFAHAESISTTDDTMVVTASRFEQPVSTVLAPVSVLTRTDLEELQASSLVDALKTLPGIEIGQNGGRGQTASIFLRGTNSNHVLVLVDGVRLPRTMLGTVDFNMLPLNTVERIEVIRGSGATVYGSDAIGGVINIITRNDAESTRFSIGGGSFGTASADVGVTRKLTDSLSMQLMGGLESVDGYNVRPDIAPADDEHGFESKNVSLRLSYAPSQNWNSNVIGRWYENKVDFADYGGSKKHLWVESKSIGADSGYTYGKWNTQARIEVGEQKNYDYAEGSSPSADNLTSEIRQIYSSLTSRYQVRDNLAVTTGVDLTLEKYLDGNFISIDSIEDNPRQNIGVFGLANWNITDSILLEGSVRHDDNDQFGGNTTSLISAGWTINEDYRLFASYGTAFKAPTFDKLYGSSGNVNLIPEESENVEIGFEGTTYDVSWSLNGYINTIDNLIVYSGSWPNGKNENVEEARIKGIELIADFDLGPVYNQVSLELRDPKDVSKNEQLARRAKQLAKWRTSVWLGDVLLGTQFMYQGERPNYSGGGMLDAYSVWDLTAQYDISNNITLGGKVANLFDEEYETAGDYPAAERAFYVNLNFAY